MVYSDVKTLIDGGKHLGNDNFPVNFALFRDQMSSANMARLDVEYTERGYSEKIPNKLKQILKDYNATDVNDFILSLGLTDVDVTKNPKKITLLNSEITGEPCCPPCFWRFSWAFSPRTGRRTQCFIEDRKSVV